MALLLIAPSSAAAEFTRLHLGNAFSLHGAAALELTSFHGDGFWDSARERQSQTNSLQEERLVFSATTPLVAGTYIGFALPLLFRSIDQVAPGSRDAEGAGLGDVEVLAGWQTTAPTPQGIGWGTEARARFPSGAANLSVADVDRGEPALAPLGSGGHELDLWFGIHGEWTTIRMGLAGGLRHRFPSTVLFVWNGIAVTRIEPLERLLGQARAMLLMDGFELGVLFEAFKEGLFADPRAPHFGGDGQQNHRWGSWIAATAAREMGDWRFELRAEVPALGREIPDLPPLQFVERDPLLGTRIGGEIAVRLGAGGE